MLKLFTKCTENDKKLPEMKVVIKFRIVTERDIVTNSYQKRNGRQKINHKKGNSYQKVKK